MGSFLGHFVPGTFFFCFSFWWLNNIFYRYFHSKRFRHLPFKNISSFPCPCISKKNFPLEGIFKIVAVCIGMMGEFGTGFDNGHFTHLGNAQHMTMFFFFGLNGVVDVCQYKNFDLPPKLDYITAALGFSVEGFLFYNHLHGRPHMDIQVHMFLFYLIVSCLVTTLLEMHYPTSIMASLSRVYFVLLQGTWFYQIGFILYPPLGMAKWDVDDHSQMMIVTLIFTWHMAGILMFMTFFGTIAWFRVQNIKGQGHYQMVQTQENSNLTIEKEDTTSRAGNGHLKNKSSIHQMLESESDEA